MESNRKPHYFFLVIILVRFIITEIPSIKYAIPTYINFGTLLLIYIYIINETGDFLYRSIKIIPVFLVFILQMLWSLVLDQGDLVVNIYGLLQELVWPLSLFFIMNNMGRKTTGYILLGMSAVLLFLTISTYVGCLNFPSASRYIATGLKDDPDTFAMFAALNIGDYEFLYLITYTIPFIAFIFHNYKKYRLISLLLYIFIVITLIEAEYTTAIMCALFFCFLFIFSPDYLHNHRFSIITCFLVIVFLLPTILNLLSSFFVSSDVIYERLHDASIVLSGGEIKDNGSDVISRWESHRESWQSFMSSPIFGTGNNGGGHSYFLDTLSYLGLFGLFALIISFKHLYKVFIYPFKGSPIFYSITLLFILEIFLSLYKGTHTYFSLTFFTPLICVYFSKQS